MQQEKKTQNTGLRRCLGLREALPITTGKVIGFHKTLITA